MNGTKATLAIIAAMGAVGAIVRRRSGSRNIEWVLDEDFDIRGHFEFWSDPELFTLRSKIEWWDIDDVYTDQDFRDESIVRRYADDLGDGRKIIPLLIHDTGEIMDGHHRWWAAKKVDIQSIPVVVMDYKG